MSDDQLAYPRPDFDRSARWESLDGAWEFSRGADSSDSAVMLRAETVYSERIVVPFPWESRRSGVEAHWLERGWYRRTVTVPTDWQSERVILHFGGVHQRARVFLDGQLVGQHVGAGPFECDLGQDLGLAERMIVVDVEAPVDKGAFPHGKQRSIPRDGYDSCSFEPSSGIWQPVWLEPRPATFLRRLRCRALSTLDGFVLEAQLEGQSMEGALVHLVVRGGAASADVRAGPDGRARAQLHLPEPVVWSPRDPYIYFVDVEVLSTDGRDDVTVPTGLRTVAVVGDEIRLNGRRVYLRGVLDQGYWPDSGLSAPGPQALRRDLELARAAGYNFVRKHIKLEDPRWLCLADSIGMLVWEEPPSTSRYSAASLAAFNAQVEAMVARDANHPSVIVWGLFNEEWGLDWKVADDHDRQEAVRGTVRLLRQLDESRPVIDNSGWSHVDTDLADWHYYESDIGLWAKNVRALVHDSSPTVPVTFSRRGTQMKPLGVAPQVTSGRPNLNSEYGMGLTSVERAWHLRWQTQELRRHDRLSGYVYTELYDIEHEFAGVYTFDRQTKDLGNLDPADVNAETVLVLDVLPSQPGADLFTVNGGVTIGARISCHGTTAVCCDVRSAWGRPMSAAPEVPAPAETSVAQPLEARPFELSPAVGLNARLPEGWPAGRLHIWAECGGSRVARAFVDVARGQPPEP